MTGTIDNDNILCGKAGFGDGEAFGILFDKYSKKIYRYIYYKVTVKEIAEDLTSQCFLKIWEQILAGIKIKSFQAFTYRTARNLVVDYYRTREREELPLIYQFESEEGKNIETVFDENLDHQHLEKILLTLKGEIREIVLLRFIEELSIKEISKIVEKTPANVRVILHRAIKELEKNTRSQTIKQTDEQ